MLKEVFNFNLEQMIPERVVTIAKRFNIYLVNGEHPSLVAGTLGGKVLIYNPHDSL